MGRASRVTVKPQLGALHRTTAGCLVDKALRHQGNLIQQDACQSDALYQVLGAFVFAAKQIKAVGLIACAHHNLVFRAVLLESEHAAQPRREVAGHISAQTLNGLATQSKVLTAEIGHCPHDKANCHGNGLAGTDGAVTDDALIILKTGSIPPGHCQVLPGAQFLILHWCPTPLWCFGR